MLKSPLIIFVMGGPGCGKGTQCRNMATKYGFCHVGLGQLLRQEAQRGTRRGQKIREIMLQGLLVPTVRAHRCRGGRKKRLRGDELPRKAPWKLMGLEGCGSPPCHCLAVLSLCVPICKMGEQLGPQQESVVSFG